MGPAVQQQQQQQHSSSAAAALVVSSSTQQRWWRRACVRCGRRACRTRRQGGGNKKQQIVAPSENLWLQMASLSRVRSGGSSSAVSRHSSAGDNTPTSCIDDDDRGSLEPFLPAVVQVFCASAANDWSVPWTRDTLVKSPGSGWIFDAQKRIIVTNAHVVEFASTLQVGASAASARAAF